MGQIFLKPDDIAKAVIYAINQPQNVDVREILIASPKEYSL
jgi:NADP-dependent 3-hydroxy acid dehydrogenase YdfG